MPAPARQQTPFDYWISFWPTAPLFGVKWRFENLAPGLPFFRPVEVMAQMTAASAREVALATSRQAETAVAAVQKVVDAAPVAAATSAIRAETAGRPLPAEPVAHAEPAAQAEPVAHAEPAAHAQPAKPAAQPEPEPSSVAGTGALRPALLFDTAPVEADDLKQIKGVGPKLEAMLNGMGIYRFDQIAEMTDGNLQWVDDNLTTFKGRPIRDDWVAQARALV